MARRIILCLAVFFSCPQIGHSANRVVKAQLVDDFLTAMKMYGDGAGRTPASPAVSLWIDGMLKQNISPEALKARFSRHQMKSLSKAAVDSFAKYRKITIEDLPSYDLKAAAPPMALHAFRFDVVEDSDDVLNDSIYCYFITTHDDFVWGKVTSIYSGLDEGQSFFFNPEDRGLFDPKGDKMIPVNHTLVDFGIVESDSGDITQLKKLSDAIIDLAVVALAVYDPSVGAGAAKVRAETQNLMRLIVEMDSDDRLVADTLRMTPDSMASQMAGDTVNEFSRFYEQSTTWSHYAYRIHFRLLK